MSRLQNIYSNYENKWIALAPDRSRVLVSGTSIKDVEKKLKDADKDVVITYVMPFDKSFAPLCRQ